MRALPDVTSHLHADTPSILQWVGMEDIAVPINLQQTDGTLLQIAAKANAFVSLNAPESKGIHMSRIHRAVNELAARECHQKNINDLLESMISSQAGISHNAKIELAFNLILSKPALLSPESGFQSYPVIIRAEKNSEGFTYEFELSIPYSSTCPCSASLTRQLYAEAIDDAFPTNSIDKDQLLAWAQSHAGSVATPHSQRSFAYIRITTGDSEWPDLSALIFQLEEVIGTPVQTAVKRVDEQAFARLNADNLMFCEDAARRLKQALDSMPYAKDYWFKVEHQESLHAHNAVVMDQKS